ncbi:hypothetical protein [Fimbriimonas ginsengisoli]|uniref:Uncharacterized protein n=1 Tax=Fimbriimonas ginsengisoli Gsoil 348 TaxID=661478 RepID=A0A068NTK0_FIMGI|nr:hypothetical protein [Fimbriimonas ginsengisoli]AIE86677.1 hypothetical protein OP10G_3309 [Fimbriimonas ginsengisoli Gsoil 348]
MQRSTIRLKGNNLGLSGRTDRPGNPRGTHDTSWWNRLISRFVMDAPPDWDVHPDAVERLASRATPSEPTAN